MNTGGQTMKPDTTPAISSNLEEIRDRMRLTIEIDREDDGRFLAEVSALPGVMAYGSSAAEATARVKALALHVLAERIEHGEPLPVEVDPLFSTRNTA
jgi:predicted RNase H-like HicB family nuclease